MTRRQPIPPRFIRRRDCAADIYAFILEKEVREILTPAGSIHIFIRYSQENSLSGIFWSLRPMEKKAGFWKKVDRSLNIADGYVLKADMLAHDRRFEEAVEYYDKALEIVPGNADVWAFKGITLQGGLGKDEEAMKCWERAKALDQTIAMAVDMTREETGKGVEIASIPWSDLKDSCRDKLKRMMLKQVQSEK
jgi:tetratricopeptide (TPR) repeat protein